MNDEALGRKIILVLMDEQRRGNPGKFSLEGLVSWYVVYFAGAILLQRWILDAKF